MAVSILGGLGSGTSTSASTSLTVTAATNIPAGTLLVLALTFDNHASTTAATLSLTAAGGGSWTQRGTTTGSGVTTTAGSGIWGAVFTCLTTSAISSGATITTITFGSSVVKKVAQVNGFAGVQDLLRNTVASGTSTAGTPSAVTTGTALVAGDLVVGAIHGENNAAFGADTDTLNGSWAAGAGIFTTGGSANTNVMAGIQGKVVTATGAQTFNATTANDAVAFVFALQPIPEPTFTQAAYRFFADGTESGSTALAAQDAAYTADLSGGDVSLHLRARLQITANAGFASDDYQLQYDVNSAGAWPVVPTSAVALSDTVPSTDGSVDGTSGTSYTTGAFGQSFLGNGATLVRAGFFMDRTGVPTGTLSAALYAHTGTYGTTGVGTGAPLATSTTTMDVQAVDTGAQVWYYFDFAGFQLTNGTPYVIACTLNIAGDTSNLIAFRLDNTTPTHGGIASRLSNSGTWAVDSGRDMLFEVYTAHPVIAYDSASLTDAEATTNRLGAGTGSFSAGRVSETGTVSDLAIPASSYTELLYSLTLTSASLANADTVRFRVARNGVITGLTHTVTPTVNVTKVGGGTVTGTGSAAGEGATTAAASVSVPGAASVTGVGATVATASVIAGAVSGDAAVTGAGAVMAAGKVLVPGMASAAGVGAVSATATVQQPGTATVGGLGSVAAVGSVSGSATATTTGTGAVTALVRQQAPGPVTGAGSVAALVRQQPAVPTVTAAGVTAAGAVQRVVAAVLGTGATTAAAGGQVNGTAAVAAVGTVTATAVGAAGGQPKVWTGSVWVKKPGKVWNGSAWVAKPWKVWTGSTWKTLV